MGNPAALAATLDAIGYGPLGAALRAGVRAGLPFIVESARGPLTVRTACLDEGPAGSLVACDVEGVLVATEHGPLTEEPSRHARKNRTRYSIRLDDETAARALRHGELSSVVRTALVAWLDAQEKGT